MLFIYYTLILTGKWRKFRLFNLNGCNRKLYKFDFHKSFLKKSKHPFWKFIVQDWKKRNTYCVYENVVQAIFSYLLFRVLKCKYILFMQHIIFCLFFATNFLKHILMYAQGFFTWLVLFLEYFTKIPLPRSQTPISFCGFGDAGFPFLSTTSMDLMELTHLN